MIRSAISCLALVCLVSCGQHEGSAAAAVKRTAAAPPGSVAPLGPSDPTLDQLLDRYAGAVGGRERLLAVKTLRLTGKMTNYDDVKEAPITIEKLRAGGRYLRRLVTGGVTVVQAVDGTTVWEVDPGLNIPKPRRMDALHARRYLHRVAIEGPLIDYRGKGERVALVGKEKVDGADAYRLRLLYADGLVSYFLIDAKAFLLTRVVDVVQTKEPYEVETTYSDFRKVSGVLLPFDEKTVLPDLRQHISWDKIEVDVPLDGAAFKMPA
jgi:hypothetical protein